MQKKTYATPKLTDHGSVVKETKGMVGDTYEPMGRDVWETRGTSMKVSFTTPPREE
ncbi:MAG: hypothetical protein WEE89_19905 [Gemmatimonadota bacterium]